MKKSFEKVSEKVLPYKVRSIIWHKQTDLIIVNSGKYFEVQRISFKHETIFKREEKCDIVEIVIMNSKELIAVVLIDGTVNYLNINNGEVILSSAMKKPDLTFISQIDSPLKSINEESSSIPFKEDLVFNSFSKIDVSKVSFFNDDFSFSHFFIYNKTKNSIDFYINLLLNYAHLPVQVTTTPPIVISPFILNSMIYMNKINSNGYEIKIVTISPELLDDINIANYQLAFSLSMIDYILQILSIITKIISKLGYILFDKYQFANNLTYIITSENKNEYLKKFNNELKQLFLIGKVPECLALFLQNDLFEAKTIYKMEKNIHFNLKNVEDILIESVKPVLNRLIFYFNELKFNQMLKDNKEMNAIEDKCGVIFFLFEETIKMLLDLNYDYRNFLGWILVFNSKEINKTNGNENGKNNLNSIVIDYERCFAFINKEEYNMKKIITQVESELNESIQEDNVNCNVSSSNNNTPIASISAVSNVLLTNYLKDNDMLHLIKQNSNNSTNATSNNKSKAVESSENKQNISIKQALTQLKQSIINVQASLYDTCSSAFATLPKDLFKIKNLQSPITDLTVIQNIIGNHIFYFTNNIDLKQNLIIIIFIPSTNSYMLGKINFTYENSITILSFQITKQNELILLVKSTSQTQQVKYTIILSDLSNYKFIPLENGTNTFDLFNQGEIEDIKIDSFADVEASDNSFISIGERRLLGLVNNSINKITIIDILN